MTTSPSLSSFPVIRCAESCFPFNSDFQLRLRLLSLFDYDSRLRLQLPNLFDSKFRYILRFLNIFDTESESESEIKKKTTTHSEFDSQLRLKPLSLFDFDFYFNSSYKAGTNATQTPNFDSGFLPPPTPDSDSGH